jgi:hypothetical protein
MATRLRPRKWALLGNCSHKCLLHERHLSNERREMVHGWYEQGLNDKEIAKNCFEAGFSLGSGTIGRHRANHMEPLGEIRESRAQKKRTDLEIIEDMIQAGGERAGQYKMTPSETMKAMELKYKMTQGSAFEGMLDALTRAAMEEDDLEPMPNDPSMADESGEDEEEVDIYDNTMMDS